MKRYLNVTQCDHMAGLFFNILPFSTMKICCEQFSQNRFETMKNIILTRKNCQRLLTFGENGEISPNLVVTLK